MLVQPRARVSSNEVTSECTLGYIYIPLHTCMRVTLALWMARWQGCSQQHSVCTQSHNLHPQQPPAPLQRDHSPKALSPAATAGAWLCVLSQAGHGPRQSATATIKGQRAPHQLWVCVVWIWSKQASLHLNCKYQFKHTE